MFDELNSLEDDLGPGIDTLVHFAGLIDRGVPTDYLNTWLHFQLDGSLGGLLDLPLQGPGVTTLDPDGPGDLKGTPLVPPDLVGGLTPGSSTENPGPLGGLLGLFGGDR